MTQRNRPRHSKRERRPAPRSGVAVSNQKERTGRRGLALFSNCGMRTSAAPRHANPPPRRRPFVRRLSYELRIASVTLARSLSRRTRHPPPHTQLEKAFHHAGHPISGCRAAGSEPPAYRFLRATLHALSPLMARGTSSCLPRVVRWPKLECGQVGKQVTCAESLRGKLSGGISRSPKKPSSSKTRVRF